MEQRYVGIDLHRRRSVIVHKDAAGTILSTVQLDNDDLAGFSAELARAGEHPEVVLEATYGWYWLADLLEQHGAHVHLAHPLGNNWGHRRLKTSATRRTWSICCASVGSRRPTSPRHRFASCVSSSATGQSSSRCAAG